MTRIRFEPPLPPGRRHLQQRSGMGAIIKAVLLYKTAFWRDAALSGEIVADAQAGPVFNVYDESRPIPGQPGQEQPALVTFINGQPARVWATRSYEDRRTGTMRMACCPLRRTYPLMGEPGLVCASPSLPTHSGAPAAGPLLWPGSARLCLVRRVQLVRRRVVRQRRGRTETRHQGALLTAHRQVERRPHHRVQHGHSQQRRPRAARAHRPHLLCRH
jgi:hypothetical protein